MIRITRLQSVQGLEEMYPHFVFTDIVQRQQLIRQLTETMLQTPESLLVLQAISDVADPGLVGFVVANNVPGASYVWVAQAWSQPGNDFEVADAMWARVRVWACALGKSSVRAQTGREIDVIYRRFGFEELCKIVEHKLDPALLGLMVEGIQEVANG